MAVVEIYELHIRSAVAFSLFLFTWLQYPLWPKLSSSFCAFLCIQLNSARVLNLKRTVYRHLYSYINTYLYVNVFEFTHPHMKVFEFLWNMSRISRGYRFKLVIWIYNFLEPKIIPSSRQVLSVSWSNHSWPKVTQSQGNRDQGNNLATDNGKWYETQGGTDKT